MSLVCHWCMSLACTTGVIPCDTGVCHCVTGVCPSVSFFTGRCHCFTGGCCSRQRSMSILRLWLDVSVSLARGALVIGLLLLPSSSHALMAALS